MGDYLMRITADVKRAMKAKAKDRLTVLRMLVSSIKNEQEANSGESLGEDAELAILLRAVKMRKESVKQALEVDRQDIADSELAEIAIIETYLPQQMSSDELVIKVKEVADEVRYASPMDTGKFMQVWMSRYKGQADGRDVQAALRSLRT
jgi:hypothetical protein